MSRTSPSGTGIQDGSPDSGISSFVHTLEEEVHEEVEFAPANDDRSQASDTDRDEALSTTSSVASEGPEYKLNPREMVNLTGSRFCWVIFQQKHQHKKYLCCCGNLADTCKRQGYDRTRTQPTKIAAERYYVRLEGKGGLADGRLDMLSLTAEEAANIMAAEQEEMQRIATELHEQADEATENTEEDAAAVGRVITFQTP